MRHFEATIAKENRKLGKLLKGPYTPKYLCPSYYDDDHILRDCKCGHCLDEITVIPVTVKKKSGTTITVEDGYITDCDHFGAELDAVEVARSSFNERAGNYEVLDVTETRYVCDGCDETSYDGEDW